MKACLLKKPEFYAIALLWIAGATPLIYWRWLDNPVVYTRNIATVDNPNDIHPGGELKFTKDVCVTRDPVQNTAHRWITNTYLTEIIDPTMQATIGCSVTKRVIPIPKSIELGLHQYHYKATFQINPIKSEVIENAPFPFVVTADPDNPEPNKGDKGDKGDKGLRGQQGFEGQTGPQGPAGD
jgi:hypothetical protein